MPDYIPKDEPGRIQWIANFAQWLTKNGEAHDNTPDEIAAIITAAENANAAVTQSDTLHAAAYEATVAKKKAIAETLRLMRPTVRRVQANRKTTDKERADARITVPKTNRTPKIRAHILTLPPPQIRITYTGGDSFAIHWGPNPPNEKNNGRPQGVRLCEIQIAPGGIPALSQSASTSPRGLPQANAIEAIHKDAWRHLELVTTSPVIIPIDDTNPTPNAYRVRYLNFKGDPGPFSEPITFALTRTKEQPGK